MEDSILTTIKKLMGFAPDYKAFDPDVISAINYALSVLHQLGVGPEGFSILDDTLKWNDLSTDPNVVSMAKIFIYLKCRLVVDPPQNSFLVSAIEKQVEELTYRLYTMKDNLIPIPVDPVIEEV